MRMLRSVLMLLTLSAGLAHGQERSNDRDIDANGGVICIWAIYIGMKAVGEACYPEDKSGFVALLDELIEKFDVFVMENAPMQRGDVENFKTAQRAPMVNRSGLCDKNRNSAALGLYERLRHSLRDAGAARDATAKFLSVPRKPGWNPCL
jgi:hypothetical protein